MGKKKKKSPSCSSTSSLNNEYTTNFQEEVIQHLQLLKESKGLVTGFNAVIRGIEKESLDVIIYVSRNGISAMYHALSLMCKGKDLLFLRLQDITSIHFSSEIRSSTTYGIKKSVLVQPQFSKLLKRINTAKNSQKNQKKKASEKTCLTSDIFCDEVQSSVENIKNEHLCKNSDIDFVIHRKHFMPKQQWMGRDGMLKFQDVDFPNYKMMFDQISISIE